MESTAVHALADAPARAPPLLWPWPARPWARLHLDFMGPIAGRTYLVVVDAMSKWIEVFNMTSISANCLIDRLNELFSRWGLPRQIVTDNGTQFSSKEFDFFNKYNGIEDIFTAPYHPASNGLAENAVKILKRVVKKAIQERSSIDRALWSFLIYYRNVEHSTTGQSPAMLLLGRRTRTRLDAIRPDREGRVQRAQTRQQEASAGVDRRLDQEEQVWYRQYLKGEKWVPGRIIDVLGSSNFRVVGREGEIVHRHVDQLRKRPSNGRLSLVSVPSTLGQRSEADASENQSGLEQVETEAESGEPGGPAEQEREEEEHRPTAEPTPDSPETFYSPPQTLASRARPVRRCRENKPCYRI